MVRLAALVFALVLSACASDLTAVGRGVRLTDDARDVRGCDLINRFSGSTYGGANIEGARDRLREVAGAHGANAVLVIEEFDNNGSRSVGDAYACPASGAPKIGTGSDNAPD